MGNTTSCCVSSSPKHRRNNHSRLEPYRPEPELSREDTGCNLQHISDRENLDDLPMEYNPSDHPRASTIFLSKSQTDGEHYSLLAMQMNDYIIIRFVSGQDLRWWQKWQ